MTEFLIAPIVEGYGEVHAVPVLLHRVLTELRGDAALRVNPALRVKPGSFNSDEAYFEKYVQLASRKVRPHPRGSVLILLDCEDDCPAKVGCTLAAWACAMNLHVPVTVALAHREYETWFLAAAASLRGVRGLPAGLDAPLAPESIRGAKEWLGDRMPHGYNAPNDQPAFTRVFSFEAAARVPSFARLRGKLRALFEG